jgi:hypothetical protein
MGTCRIAVVSLASLALVPCFFAQQQPKEQLKLEGIVINSATGKPLARALVQVNQRFMLTGPEGDFSFDGLPSLPVQVRATKPGYFPPGVKGGRWSPLTVEVGSDTGKVVLKLEPEAVITGRITDDDDGPVEGISVQVLAYSSTIDGPPQLLPVSGGGSSDVDGNFRIAGLPAGRYYVVLHAGGVNRGIYGTRGQQRNEAYPPEIYYPGTPDLAAAGPINLTPGQRAEAPFSINLVPAYKVSGVVVASSDWKQVQRPVIVDVARQPLFTADSFDAKSGAFDFSALPAGTYTLRCNGVDTQDHWRFTDYKIVVAQAITNLRLALKPGVTVPVVFRSEFTKPRVVGACSHGTRDGGTERSDCSDYPPARVELISTDSPGQRFSTGFAPTANAAATAIQGIAAGKYLVRAQPTLGGYVQSLRSGSVDLLREELTVPEGGDVPPIEVVVRDDSATLAVKLHTEWPGQKAVVVVFPDGALMLSPNLKGATGSEMHFGPLAPGNYKVFAFDALDTVDTSPATLARYSAKAAQVTVSANTQSSVIVDVIHVEE